MAKSDDLTNFQTVLNKANLGPLFDTVYDALVAAKTPAEARAALELYTKSEVDAGLALKADLAAVVTQAELDAQLQGKLDRNGGIMISQLTLPAAAPTENTHAASKEYVDTKVSATLEAIYPVGSIYLNASVSDPNNFLPGTWAKVAQGRTLVGEGTLGTDSYIAKATGGEARHTLTVNEMPSHNHAPRAENANFLAGVTAGGTSTMGAGTGVLWSGVKTADTGGSQPHENRMPYYVVNIWERTA